MLTNDIIEQLKETIAEYLAENEELDLLKGHNSNNIINNQIFDRCTESWNVEGMTWGQI